MVDDISLIDNYGTYLSGFRRKKTVSMYIFLLKHFIDYLHGNNKNLSVLKAEDVQIYIQSKDTWSNTSKVHFLTILKSFLQKYYLNQFSVGITNEELRVQLQKESNIRAILSMPLPHKETVQKNKSLSLFEVKTLLDYVKKKSVLEYCLMYVLFYTGCRKSEITYLNPSVDINWKENYIVIQAEKSKTHTQRILYFSDYVKQCLIYILKSIGSKTQLVCKEETYLNKVFYKYNRIVGVHLFPHQCRHTWITEMQKSLHGKIDIDVVSVIKILAGHGLKQSDMTSHYTNYEPYLKDAMLKYHYLHHF